MADRLALTVVGYGATFLVLGRPGNAYWGLMIAPLWPIGLLWTASALRGRLDDLLAALGASPQLGVGTTP